MFNSFFPQLWLFYLFILIFLRTFAPNKIKTFMNSKKRYMVIALLALLVVSAMAYNDEAKPWTFWNWKYGSVSRPGIHADLTGMKNVGMGGIWLMPVREAGERLEFQDGVAQLSPEFWKMMDYSFQLADSLDFDMGIHVLPGNPLVLPAESMQKVVWTDTIMKGGKKIEGLQMWLPESYKDGKMQSAGSEGGYYQDIAAFAIRFKGKTGPAWRNATDSAARSEAVPMTDVLPLKMEGGMVMGVMVNGILQNKLPKGSWCLLRMGHTSTGQTHATDGKGMGLEVDRFSLAAVKKLFNSWYAPLLNRPHGDVVSYLYIDPREWGSQNWGCQFAEEFKVRRGYDLIPYLPVMAGVPLESASRYEQVQNDIRLTIEELVKEKFFQTFTRLAEEQYVEVSCAPIPRTDHPDDMFRAVSRAHIYNENPVQAVVCTGNYGAQNGTPALLKPLIDRHLALGINRFIFQHDIVRHPEARGFMDYITMCQHYLQQGRPVVDIAVFTGEEIPSRSLTPNKLVPMLPGVFGAERVASEQKRMANVGIPMEESPVGVTHSANILDLKYWCNALHGYKYDSMNKDALLKWNFEYSPKGKLPGNQDYRILVVPQPANTLSAEVKAKIEELREEGIIIIDKPYQAKDFSQYGIEPDVVLPENMDYAHRCVLEATGRKDIYFLTNQEDKERQITATFRTRTSKIRQVVKLSLPAYGSAFVILSNKEDMQVISQTGHKLVEEEGVGFAENYPSVLAVADKWKVHFDDIRKDTTVTLPFDWSKSADEKMKYYSGHVTFTSSFEWGDSIPVSAEEKMEVPAEKTKAAPSTDGFIKIQLGKIGDVARVLVNGKQYGYAWTAPYEVYVPKRDLKNGSNEIQIVVANTWHNALQGAGEGKAPFKGIWTNAKYRTKSKALLPAGLLSTINIVY